ncbi:MAG: hypothetical protein ABWZ99_12175 [Ilumatobacteraceae bacterium]
MSVQAWFSHDEIDVAPGETLTLPLTVHNLGETTESYSIVPAGLSASWTAVRRGNLTLFGGSQDVLDVEISPPLLPTTTAGPTVIAVRIIPTSTEDDAIVAEATLGIQPFDDCRIVTLQPVQRARHRATFEFMVENHGNSLTSARLHLVDPTNRVDGSFDPPAVGVAPGSSNLVRLKVRDSPRVFRRHTRTLDFEVEAQRQGQRPAVAPLALVQPPTIPGRAIATAVGVVALVGAAALAWFGLVEPAIEDTVATEVGEQVAQLTPTDSGVVVATTVAPATVDAPVSELGEPTFLRLAVTPAVTETADIAATIPDGEQFDLTDVRIENTANDTGTATLLQDGQPIFVWSLANIRGQFFEPRITPIRLPAGTNLTFSVSCASIGDATKTTCTSALNLGGRTITADAGG